MRSRFLRLRMSFSENRYPLFRGHALGPHFVPGRNLALRDHLAIDPAIGMAKGPHQRIGDRQVADAGVRIDIGGGATHDALDDFYPRGLSNRDLLSDEIEFAPGAPAAHVDIGAEA